MTIMIMISDTIDSKNEYGAITIKDINLWNEEGFRKIDFAKIQEAYLVGVIDKKKLNEINFQVYYLDLEPKERTKPKNVLPCMVAGCPVALAR